MKLQGFSPEIYDHYHRFAQAQFNLRGAEPQSDKFYYYPRLISSSFLYNQLEYNAWSGRLKVNYLQQIAMNIAQTSHHQIRYPKLIINADDFGYSWERCQGILELVQAKCISSTSVIVNAPQIENKCKKLVKYCRIGEVQQNSRDSQSINHLAQVTSMEDRVKWQLSIGLHLNFTQFQSCQTINSSVQNCLIDPQTNTFKGKSFIYNNLGQIKSSLLFIQNQIRAQIQKFIKIFHRRPSHIDGHNHVHLIPEFAESVCKIARLFGIYKVRLPIIPRLHKSPDETLNKFNSKFVEMASEAKKIYDSFGFLYPDYFLGLDLMGKQFSVQNFETRLKQIIDIVSSDSQITNKVVEIMVHPGYRQQQKFNQYPTCPFSMSEERQLEMKVLKSEEFSKFKTFLLSFNGLAAKKSEKTILIYSKLLKCCGNLTTSLRLHQIFTQCAKYRVYFLDVSESEEEEQAKYLAQMVNQLCIKFIVGVNLTRTAGIIHKALNGIRREISFKVPYALVVAGTDANVTLNEGTKDVLQSINVSVKESECLISLSEKMKAKIDSYLSMNNIPKQAILIRQSTLNGKAPKEFKSLEIPNYSNSQPYIVFPTSFRKVKAVQHILPELNSLIQKHNINVYVLGPIINQQYYKETILKFKKVVYLHCQPHQTYLQILRNALLLINCSESEGMSCSILQAFEQKIPVIARKNEGNSQLITDGLNGFLYENGEDFIKKFQNLLKNYQDVTKNICEKAYSVLHQQFSYKTQCQSYKKILDHIESFLYKLEISTNIQSSPNEVISLNLLSLKNVHAISPVNLKIFNKFFEKDDSNINPCFKYVGKMLGNSGESEKCLNILDVGCGNGIFTLFFVLKFMIFFRDSQEKIKINLTFLDIHPDSLRNLKVNLRTFEQLFNSWKDNKLVLQNITILQSNMFQQLRVRNLGNFDIVLANMPQTPFKNEKSRLDKNGGSDGFKLTTLLIQNYKKFIRNQNSILVMLYSHMLNQSKYKQILHTNGSKIEWVSQPEVHKIKREDYDKMEERLAYMIEENMRNGKSGIKLEGEIFSVPADLRIIKPE